MRHILAAVTIAAAATAVVTAQTLSELLQKGIYTEDTLGDTRAAVTIYRRVIGSVPAQHALAVQARRRLAAALEQSGTAQPIPAGPAEAAVPSGDTMGIVEHGRYRNLWTGVEFNIPVGWTAGRTVRSSDNGQQVAVIVLVVEVVLHAAACWSCRTER